VVGTVLSKTKFNTIFAWEKSQFNVKSLLLGMQVKLHVCEFKLHMAFDPHGLALHGFVTKKENEILNATYKFYRY